MRSCSWLHWRTAVLYYYAASVLRVAVPVVVFVVRISLSILCLRNPNQTRATTSVLRKVQPSDDNAKRRNNHPKANRTADDNDDDDDYVGQPTTETTQLNPIASGVCACVFVMLHSATLEGTNAQHRAYQPIQTHMTTGAHGFNLDIKRDTHIRQHNVHTQSHSLSYLLAGAPASLYSHTRNRNLCTRPPRRLRVKHAHCTDTTPARVQAQYPGAQHTKTHRRAPTTTTSSRRRDVTTSLTPRRLDTASTRALAANEAHHTNTQTAAAAAATTRRRQQRDRTTTPMTVLCTR